MQANVILKKTAKGLEEVEKRTHKLPGRLRAVLFMVDGQRSTGEMLDQAGALAEQLEGQLTELVAQGFIEPIRPAESTAPANPAASIAKPAPTSTSLSFPPLSAATPAPKPTISAPAPSARPTTPPPPPPPTATQLREVPVTATLPTLDSVPVMKEKLSRLLAQTMGMKAMFMTAQLSGCDTTGEITVFIDDVARQIALSGGAKAGEKWRSDARSAIGL